jgi:DNA polymerase-3 subunit delta'
MGLRDVKGQDGPLSIIKGLIRKGRVPHALLFAGEDGVGKMLTAMNLAKALNCLEPFDLDSCDRCISCSKIEKGIHPDVRVAEPGGKGKQITVDTIRALEEALSFRPYEGRWKVTIIRDAEMMNPSAANAFLKTLEEPPKRSIIILVSSRPEMIPETIRSRCQRINFSLIPVSVLGEMIKQDGVDEQRARLISELSGGSMGRTKGEELLEKREWSLRLLMDMIKMNDSQWRDRREMEEWFEWVMMWLRDMSVYRITGNQNLLINPDKIKILSDISRNAPLRNILKLARELYNIKRELILNPNTGLIYSYTGILIRNSLRISR